MLLEKLKETQREKEGNICSVKEKTKGMEALLFRNENLCSGGTQDVDTGEMKIFACRELREFRSHWTGVEDLTSKKKVSFSVGVNAFL